MEIAINKPFESFDIHLNQEDNHRTIFSGAYGTGKTYFLEKYFEKKKDQYYSVRISPVKYVTSSNEDVFEFIKADILLRLFQDGKIQFKEDLKLDNFSALSWALMKSPDRLITALYSIAAHANILDESVIFGFEMVKIIKTKIESITSKFKEKVEIEWNRDNNELEKFVRKIFDNPGSPFENNIVTQFINECLSNIQLEQKIALIIDDMDRLDPDHIFRILNILSVHNNSIGERNNYNFDKIILVCDINNIKKIYEYRYGEQVDFAGYMDKFYSIDYYSFSNLDAVRLFLEKLEYRQFGNEFELTLKHILLLFAKLSKLTIRSLLKFQLALPNLPAFIIKEHANLLRVLNKDTFVSNEVATLFLRSDEVPCFYLVKILQNIFGSFDELELALNSIEASNNDVYSESDQFAVANTIGLFAFIGYDFFGVLNETGLFYKNINQIIKHPQCSTRFGHAELLLKWDYHSRKNRFGLKYTDQNQNYFLDRRIIWEEFSGVTPNDLILIIRQMCEFLKKNDFLRNYGIS